jgi:hypothetical protein
VLARSVSDCPSPSICDLQESSGQGVRVCGKVTHGHFPSNLTGDLDLCAVTEDTNNLQISSTATWDDSKISEKLYVPFPQSGLWLLALKLQCYDLRNHRFVMLHLVETGYIQCFCTCFVLCEHQGGRKWWLAVSIVCATCFDVHPSALSLLQQRYCAI